ncbi:tlc domain-containing protein [Lichtheimia corymbifera JMRC:FSU:9682]|uniref:Tlc domain-containing protein n=1 Tax=Lichtheimia corymbifera JMRC:FSU:9682 TaxID=1263082 RepID=A0A068S3I2_9FUNG|nr:tlc domain-containing protein [Lichtheimia corymbifera JMRC:FSU:9682]
MSITLAISKDIPVFQRLHTHKLAYPRGLILSFNYDIHWIHRHSYGCYLVFLVMRAIRYIKYQGIGMVFHGIAGFVVIFFSYRPFINYYGSIFLLYEASTPFLNFNWFMDKLGWTGSKLQLVNGIILISTFFIARIVVGFYMSYLLWIDIYAVKELIPLRYWIVYGTANVVTSFLNVYWFGLMLRSLRKRFPSKSKVPHKTT